MIELPKFMSGRFISDVGLCDDLIGYYKNNPSKYLKKRHYHLSNGPTILNVADVDNPIVERFFVVLQNELENYIELYPYSNMYAGFNLVPFNIQHYKPNECYDSWHCERDGRKEETIKRHLAFMLYCNTIDEDGGTEFLHQDYVCNPEKGKLIFWPSDWTFTHSGLKAPKEDKYIVTGWYEYIYQEQ